MAGRLIVRRSTPRLMEMVAGWLSNSSATNLSAIANPVDNVYVREIGTGNILLVSRSGGGKAIANGDSSQPDIPSEGTGASSRFQSVATNLGPDDGFGWIEGQQRLRDDLPHHGTFGHPAGDRRPPAGTQFRQCLLLSGSISGSIRIDLKRPESGG